MFQTYTPIRNSKENVIYTEKYLDTCLNRTIIFNLY